MGGGPAIVRNNIVVGNQYHGIWAQDYNGRGLQQNVWIVHNTVVSNQTGGIKVSNWLAGAGNVLAFNAIAPLGGTPALTPASPAADVVTGNSTCSPATSCFDQPNTAPYDLWPAAAGPLIGAAGFGLEPWRVTDDFLCVPRGAAADIGAMQRTRSGNGPPLGGGNSRPLCGAGFYALTPCRVVDTRNPTGPLGGPALNAGADRVFVFAGQCGIPPSASSVAINVAVTQPATGPGFLSFYPGGTSPPLVSTLNYSAAQTRANNAVVSLGAAGDVAVHCGQGSGTAHVVIDVNGYFQ